jgi:predicted RNA-binding Zn ribbon-like protein
LLQVGWLDQFLSRWGLQVEDPLEATTLAELLALRALLRRMVETLENSHISAEDLATLNAILSRPSLKRHLSATQQGYLIEMVPEKKDWDWVQAEIAASFAHLLTDHEPERIKICANPNCLGIFYDESKSRTRRYCTPDKCANLLKVRRFRARQKD